MAAPGPAGEMLSELGPCSKDHCLSTPQQSTFNKVNFVKNAPHACRELPILPTGRKSVLRSFTLAAELLKGKAFNAMK